MFPILTCGRTNRHANIPGVAAKAFGLGKECVADGCDHWVQDVWVCPEVVLGSMVDGSGGVRTLRVHRLHILPAAVVIHCKLHGFAHNLVQRERVGELRSGGPPGHHLCVDLIHVSDGNTAKVVNVLQRTLW